MSALSRLNRNTTTLREYADSLGMNGLSIAAEQIGELIRTCHRELKPKERYDVFDAPCGNSWFV